MRRSLSFALPAGVIVAVALIVVSIYARVRLESAESTQTSLFITLALVALWVLVVLSRPFNFWRVLIIAAMYVYLALVLAIPFVRDFFGVPWPPPELLSACLITSFVGCVSVEVLYRMNRAAQRRRRASIELSQK